MLAGTFSALGLLASECRHDYVVALGGIEVSSAELAPLERRFCEMEARGRDELRAQNYPPERIRLERRADLKVAGQTYELSITVPAGRVFDAAALAETIHAFTSLYRERYAFFYEGEALLLTNLRVSSHGLNAGVELPEFVRGEIDLASASKGSRPVCFDAAGFVDTRIYERDLLRPGMVVDGPAVIEEETSATIVPPGTRAEVLEDLGLVVNLTVREAP